jgi:hypothetical protein
MRYDALRKPSPEGWLAADEEERLLAVLDYHREMDAPHAPTPNPRLHASIHVVVENQLAAGDPPEVRETLERLMGEGLDRHEALHALGQVASELFLSVTRDKKPYDPAAHARALRALSAATLRGAR